MESYKNENITPLNGFSIHASHSLADKKDDKPLDNDTYNEDSSIESSELEIVIAQKKFRTFYQKSLAGIENCDEDTASKNGMLRVLLKYLEQLEEQNDLLIETIAELEKEASERVRQMERRLKSSAKTTMETVINFHGWEQEMQRLVRERIEMEAEYVKMQHQVSSTIVENNFLRDQSFNLNHDIQALLHIIQHARSTGHWEMDCVTFCEVTPEQVFGPMQPLEPYYPPGQRSPSPHHMFLNKFKHCSTEKLSDSDASSLRSLDLHPTSLLRKETTCRCATTTDATDSNGKCLPQKNEVATNTMHHTRVPASKNLPRSCSVPAFRRSSMCSYYKQNMFTYKSCSIIGNKTSATSSEAGDSYTLKTLFSDTPEGTKHSCNSLSRSSNTSVFRRAYSEPHMFMFEDCIYVYRPCETMQRVSSLTAKDYANNLHPCRSIDLKLRSDSQDCERAWGLHPSATDFCFSRSSFLSCSANRVSKDFSSLTHLKDFQNSMTHVDNELPSHRDLPPLFIDKRSQTDKLYSSPVRKYSVKDLSPKKKTVISCGMQTMDVKSFSIGLQADFSDQNSDSLTKLMAGSTVEGMTVADVNKTIQILKNSLQKAEDQVSAQTILIQELQGHLNTVSKNVEMKDAVLEIVEKKLNESRSETKSVKEELSTVESKLLSLEHELEDLKLLNNGLHDDVKGRQEKINELVSQEKVLQNHKRSLMTQLDAQGDVLETKSTELLLTQKTLEKCNSQMEQQNQIILSLQDALVQSKRAFDELQKSHKNHTLTKNDVRNISLQSSRSTIVDL